MTEINAQTPEERERGAKATPLTLAFADDDDAVRISIYIYIYSSLLCCSYNPELLFVYARMCVPPKLICRCFGLGLVKLPNYP